MIVNHFDQGYELPTEIVEPPVHPVEATLHLTGHGVKPLVDPVKSDMDWSEFFPNYSPNSDDYWIVIHAFAHRNTPPLTVACCLLRINQKL